MTDLNLSRLEEVARIIDPGAWDHIDGIDHALANVEMSATKANELKDVRRARLTESGSLSKADQIIGLLEGDKGSSVAESAASVASDLTDPVGLTPLERELLEALTEALAFIDGVEGDGYGGMAVHMCAQMSAREAIAKAVKP